MGSERLTKAQRETLAACADWLAPFEIMQRRHQTTGEIVCPRGLRNALGFLRNRGLVEYGRCNDTFRLTQAGRAALANGDGG